MYVQKRNLIHLQKNFFKVVLTQKKSVFVWTRKIIIFLRISGADVSTRSGQFSLNIENASGAIFHPVTTNVPEHPLTGRSNVHNYREQVPRHSKPTPPRSQNTRARVHFATEPQFADARQTDVQPSHTEQRTYLSELEPSHVNNNSYTSRTPLTDARQTDVQPSMLQLSEPGPSDQPPSVSLLLY